MNYYCTYCKKEFNDPDVFVLHSGPNCRLGAGTMTQISEMTPMTTPNEKPSERAAREIENLGILSDYFHTKALGFRVTDGNLARKRAVALLSKRINATTSCDHLQSQFDEANRQIAQLETEKQALAAENARLRAVLEKIVQNWKDDEPHCDSVSLAMEDLEK